MSSFSCFLVALVPVVSWASLVQCLFLWELAFLALLKDDDKVEVHRVLLDANGKPGSIKCSITHGSRIQSVLLLKNNILAMEQAGYDRYVFYNHGEKKEPARPRLENLTLNTLKTFPIMRLIILLLRLFEKSIGGITNLRRLKYYTVRPKS
jgi:hypothetical protein